MATYVITSGREIPKRSEGYSCGVVGIVYNSYFLHISAWEPVLLLKAEREISREVIQVKFPGTLLVSGQVHKFFDTHPKLGPGFVVLFQKDQQKKMWWKPFCIISKARLLKARQPPSPCSFPHGWLIFFGATM